MQSSIPSPNAAAVRLVTLALLADGEFGHTEIGLLERLRAFEVLEIGRSDFLDAAAAFCAELRGDAGAADVRGYLSVDAHRIRGLLAAVEDGAMRRVIAGLILEIVRADGRIHPGESLLLWEMLVAWNLRLAEVGAQMVRAGAQRTGVRAPRAFRRQSRAISERTAADCPTA